MSRTADLDLDDVRRVFDAVEPDTIGLEEEVLLLDRMSRRPVPVAAQVVTAMRDAHIETELPACQVEIRSGQHADVTAAAAELRAERAALLDACGGQVLPVAAAVHPLVTGLAAITPTDWGRILFEEYGEVVARQLVGALQVHVAVGGADRTLAVYNALRGYLPELAALAAAAPFHEGRDTGFASVRPLIASQLPRQGVPPSITSWAAFVDDLRWGTESASVPNPGRWWWELRPHVLHGTVEVRVPDVQPTVEGASAVASVVHALVRHLVARYDAGEALSVPATWRIAENRWCALRDGTHGHLADLVSGDVIPTTKRLHQLIDVVELHADGPLDGARALAEHNAADDLRDHGLDGALPWLCEVFPQ